MIRETKKTNIPWIGEIPSDWSTCRFKNIASFKKDIAKNKSYLYERLALTLNGVIKRSKDDDEGLQPDTFDSYQILNPGDFVFKMIDLQNISTSRVGKSPFLGLVSPAYLRFEPSPLIDSDFYYYYLMNLYYQCVFNKIAGDGVRSALNKDDIGNIECPVPPFEEQNKIVKKIKSKEEKINALIANEEKQIEKLKNYKQALISEVVTKGLNPNVPLKDSGLFWYGKIRSDAILGKTLFYLSMPITDGPHETPQLFDEGIPFISAEAVSCGNGEINFEHARGYISKEYYDYCCKKYIPQKNDIYMIKSGATTGKVSIVKTDIIFTIWSPLAVFRAETKKIVPLYLYYFLQSDFFQKQVQLKGTFGTQQNIGMRTLEQLLLIVPSTLEQEFICNFLDERISAIDSLIEKHEQKINELNMYRKSVIYEYVTGKREIC